jgi:hypothetical protein
MDPTARVAEDGLHREEHLRPGRDRAPQPPLALVRIGFLGSHRCFFANRLAVKADTVGRQIGLGGREHEADASRDLLRRVLGLEIRDREAERGRGGSTPFFSAWPARDVGFT